MMICSAVCIGFANPMIRIAYYQDRRAELLAFLVEDLQG